MQGLKDLGAFLLALVGVLLLFALLMLGVS